MVQIVRQRRFCVSTKIFLTVQHRTLWALCGRSLRHVHVFYVESPLHIGLKSDFATAAKVSFPPFVSKCAKAAFVTNSPDWSNSGRASEIASTRSTNSVSEQNEKILRPTANHHVYCNNRGPTLKIYYRFTGVLRSDGEIKKSYRHENSMCYAWGRRL